MPFKLLGTIILLVLITIFCGFNLEEANKCDINLVFHVFKKVPVFLTVLTSFLAGIVVMLPFAFFRKKKCKDSQKTKKTEAAELSETEAAEINGKEDSTSKNAEQEKTIFDFKIRKPVTKNSKKEKKSSSEEPKEESETGSAGSLS